MVLFDSSSIIFHIYYASAAIAASRIHIPYHFAAYLPTTGTYALQYVMPPPAPAPRPAPKTSNEQRNEQRSIYRIVGSIV